MLLHWFKRFFSGLGVADSRALAAKAGEPELKMVPSENLLNAALRDAAVIHGADETWMHAEVIQLSHGEKLPDWDVRLVVSLCEADVWDRAEAFQRTFLEQLRALSGDSWRRAPAVTWKFQSQETSTRSGRRVDPGYENNAVEKLAVVPNVGLKGELVI